MQRLAGEIAAAGEAEFVDAFANRLPLRSCALGVPTADYDTFSECGPATSGWSSVSPLPAGSNDLLMPIADGLISAEHVYAEIGELVAGTKAGRQSIEEITLYKSVGVAVQDAAAAALVVAAARARGVGQHIELE